MDLSSLNPPQRKAVEHISGPLLVLAGAGAGKTRVITHRIAYLLEQGIAPSAIAALTFTNKAAREMKERVDELVGGGKNAAKLTVSTFHSLGLQILKKEHDALGLPPRFVVYDTADQLGVIREILRNIDMGGRRFDLKAILTRISLSKNAFISPDDYEAGDSDEYDEITAEVYPRYREALRAYAAVDFDDLITATVELFRTQPEVAERWATRFRHVLVDEFQDTNRSQLLFLQELVKHHGNLCVVGDDDQSIYSWRGADTRNLLGFERRFPGAEVVKLEQNYRSTPLILRAANATIANNVDRYGKELWSDRADGPPIVHAVAADPAAEAQWVARRITELVDNGDRRHKDFAILYRSNIQNRLIEEELRLLDIPFAMFGGQQFYERKEVKDLIAYLRVGLNTADEISLRRIINYPSRGIGATTLTKLGSFARDMGRSLWSILNDRAHLEANLQGRTVAAIDEFMALMAQLRAMLTNGDKPAIVVRQLIEDIDLYGDLRKGSPSLKAAQHRIDNVESFIGSLTRFGEREDTSPKALRDYLLQLTLATDEGKEKDVDNRVTLTTLHGAKGLEFPVVFLIGLEEELLPHARSLMPHATDVNDADHVTDVSEERRLFYVGVTRAKDELIISRAATRVRNGKRYERTPSRFLFELPEDLVEDHDIAAVGAEQPKAAELADFFASLAN